MPAKNTPRNYTGASINIVIDGHTIKDTIMQHFHNGTVRTDRGRRFRVLDIYNKGRDLYVDMPTDVSTEEPNA